MICGTGSSALRYVQKRSAALLPVNPPDAELPARSRLVCNNTVSPRTRIRPPDSLLARHAEMLCNVVRISICDIDIWPIEIYVDLQHAGQPNEATVGEQLAHLARLHGVLVDEGTSCYARQWQREQEELEHASKRKEQSGASFA